MENQVIVMRGDARRATIKALEILNPKIVGSSIVIKPNLASRVRDRGENTDVEVVEGVVEHFHDKTDITIAEGCCGATNLKPDSTCELFRFSGYSELENKYGVKLVDLNTDVFQEVKLHDKVIRVAKTVLNAHYLVTVPVLKTHVYTTVSLSVKNLMGCLEPKPTTPNDPATKWEIHSELSECDRSSPSRYEWALRKFERRLIALYEKLSPKLAVIDAIVGSEGDAPIHGRPKSMGLVLASKNPVSCDAVAAYLMGMDPRIIGHIQLAQRRKLGQTDVDQIETNVDLDFHRRKFRLPSSTE